jgi:hypothetical protein
MPLMAWNPIRDLGNTFAGNGVVITHTFTAPDTGSANWIEWPNISLNRVGSNPNVSLTQNSTYVWTISGIRTAEDYLAAGAFLDFPRDYAGSGNTAVPATGSWTTNIKNSSVATYDFTYPVNLEIENFSEIDPVTLGDVAYNYYGNTTAEYTNIPTEFTSLQTTQITDIENPDTDMYTVTIATQHHSSQIVFSSDTTPVPNIAQHWGYVSANDHNGMLTVTGSKTDVNLYLQNLKITKYDDTEIESYQHPNQKIISRGAYYSTAGTGSVPNNSATAYTEISSYSPYAAPQGRYSLRFVNSDEAYLGPASPQVSYQQGYMALGPYGASGDINPFYHSSWDGTSIGGSCNTIEFWLNSGVAYDTTIDKQNFAILNNKLTVLWGFVSGGTIPDAFGQTTPLSSYPRRIVNSTTIVPGTWYHVALVRDTSDQFHLYVNGQEDSTYYSSGQTTTTAAGTTTWASLPPVYWGGTAGCYNVGGGYWKPAHFNGYVTDIRISLSARYTSEFTPPTYPLTNDYDTAFLSNFINGSVIDDYALPTFSSASNKQFTWNFYAETGNATSNAIATTTQNYYPVLRNPVFELGDINFQSTDERQSRIAYAGVDISNNPIFVYGFRGDDGNIKIKVNKVENATGNVVVGPTVNITSGSVGNPELPVQCISDFEQSGYDKLDNGNTANVYIGTQFSSSGASLYKVNLNQQYSDPTLSGEPVVINSQTTYAVPVASGSLTEYALGLAQTSKDYRNIGGNVFIPMSITTNGTTSLAAYGNTTSIVTGGEVTATGKSGLSIVGFVPTQASSAYGANVYKAPVMSFALNATSSNYPAYEMSLGYQTKTSPVETGPFLSSGGGSNAIGRLQAIALNGSNSSIYGYNKFLAAIRRRYSAGTSSEYVQFHIVAGRINQNFGPTAAGDSVQFGTEQYLNTRPGQTVFDIRLGAWAIVQGSAPTRAWMLYTQDVTTDGNTTFGISTGTSKGLWYRSIDIDASNNITWGVPVQVTDPALGAIYGRDIVAQSISIGAWTYIYAVMAGPAQSQSTTPYIISLRLPN